jgi:hypothetical protein
MELMKNYSSKRAKKGKTTYRTPSRFIAQKSLEIKQRPRRAFNLAKRLDRKGREKN